jgi:RecB family exonuclease
VPAYVPPAPHRARPAPSRLSYSQLADYGRCGYRFYLRRILGLPDVAPPPPLEDEAYEGIDARVRGSIVHRLLENPELELEDVIEDLELTGGEIDDIQGLVAAFAASPLYARLAAAGRVTREAGFAFTLEPDGSGPLVRGFVDALAVEADGTHLVVDYKTDRLPEDTTPADYIARNYEIQRLVYGLAALRAGAPRAEVAYCLLERPDEPVTTIYSAADAPELADRLSALARGVMAHEYPVTDTPHRELCGTCPGREQLCSHPQSLTLRPPPAPWPGAPVRHSSPAGTAPAAGPPPR